MVHELCKGAVQVLPEDLFEKKCARKKPLIIKLGLDPTAPDLHLGHAIVLGKMRQFQDAGHTIVFLIGDFTARVGDPTGKSKTRPPLTTEEIEKNAKTYFKQVSRILDPKRTQVRYNSEWLSKIDLASWLQIAGKVTLARIIERDDFAKRLNEKSPIGFHELFYPLMQGYDSVALKADVELGGTDQTFNLLMGRHLQECYEQEPQVIMTMPLLEGLDGVQKMSKSLGNHVGLTEEPGTAFGKLMSISDDLMWRYYELLLDATEKDVTEMRQQVKADKAHPMELKKEMAQKIVAKFWSEDEAMRAREQFQSVFQERDYSQGETISLPKETPSPLWVIDLLKKLGAIQTSSEGKRLITAGAVIIDGEKITDFSAEVPWNSGTTIKVGKHRIYLLA